MTDDLGVYEVLLKRTLERGVPSQVVADIFELPTDVVKDMRKEVVIKRFSTADQAEYLDWMQWETLERTAQIIATGSPDQVARIATTVFGKQIQAAGRRPSSAMEEQRAELLDELRSIRESPAKESRPGRFVAGNTKVDRRANRVEDDED